MKLKRMLKRSISCLLAVLMLVTVMPSIALADDGVGDSGNNAGGGSGNAGASSNSLINWSKDSTGYRFYLVSRDGFEQASSVVDILYSQKNLQYANNPNAKFTSIRGQELSTDQSNWNAVMWSTVVNDITTIVPGFEMPIYPIGDGAGHGLKFKEWMIGSGGGMSLNSIGSSSGSNTSSTSSTSRPTPSGGGISGSTSGSTSASSAVQAQTNTMVAEVNSNSYVYSRYNNISYSYALKALYTSPKLAAGRARIENIVNIVALRLKSYYQEALLAGLGVTNARRYAVAKIEPLYRVYCSTYGADGSSVIIKLAMQKSIGSQNLSTGQFSGSTDFENQNIALDGESSQNAVRLLSYLYQQGYLNIYGYSGDEYGIIEYMQQQDLLLIVEPVTWVAPADSAGNSVGYRVYGSLGNIYQYHEVCGYADKSLYQYTILGVIGGNCMIVGNVVDCGSVVIQPNTNNGTHTIRESINLVESWVGYAMHIYDVSGLDSSGTHTWDYSLGSNPGPAPDPTNLPDTTDDSGNSLKRYTIVKYYEDRDEDGTVTFRSEQYYSNKGSLPNTQDGSAPGNVVLNDPETTLHVLLVRKETGNGGLVGSFFCVCLYKRRRVIKYSPNR